MLPSVVPIPCWKPVYITEPFSSDIDHVKEASHDYQTQNNYLEDRVDFTAPMRTILLSWVRACCIRLKLLPETYYMAANIIDRFLARRYVDKEFLQCVGISATHIAAKFEEVYPPDISDWLRLSCDTYDREQILKMEKVILESIDYKLNTPTAIHFLEKLIKDSPDNVQYISRKILSYAIQTANALEFRPSQLASAVFEFSSSDDSCIEDCQTNGGHTIRPLIVYILHEYVKL